MSKLIITSSVPGRRRARTVFTGAEAFALNRFTREQLEAIVADAHLTVVVGEIITADNLGKFLEVVDGYAEGSALQPKGPLAASPNLYPSTALAGHGIPAEEAGFAEVDAQTGLGRVEPAAERVAVRAADVQQRADLEVGDQKSRPRASKVPKA